MKDFFNTTRIVNLTGLGILSIILLGACGNPSPPIPQLRVINTGTMPIENFTILFPEEEVNFGNVPADSTSEYLEVPQGVYIYAAYRYELDGEILLQPVEDWVGETPLEGNKFTYTVNFNSSRERWEKVRLIDVSIDE